MTLAGLPAAPPPRLREPRTERQELRGEPASVPEARRFVRQALARWQRADLEEAGTLLVSELVSNAVLHARTGVTVELVEGDGTVLLIVADGSPALPVVRRHGPTASTGRGLWLLDQYSLRHGVDRTAEGKQVWSELRPETPLEPADDAALPPWLDEIESL